MKRIAVCMDGTWQRLSRRDSTNIAVIARSVAHSVREANGYKTVQIVVYSRGVGAYNELEEKGAGLTGGMFGEGLEDALLDTYLRLAFNYEPEDEIYIFGFSRGAFSARSLAGLIAKCGIVSRRHAERAPEAFKLYRDQSLSADSPKIKAFREETGKRIYFGADAGKETFYRTGIKYLGIFDTVGQRGMPSILGPISDALNKKFTFHNLNLSPMVDSARHALALDEQRWMFPPTPWENFEELNAEANRRATERGATLAEDPYQQRWFPGSHGDVGGGGGARLSAFPLEWIVQGAEAQGLVFDKAHSSKYGEATRDMDPTAPFTSPKGFSALSPANWQTGPRKLPKYILDDRKVTEAEARKLIHPVVEERMVRTAVKNQLRYRPAALRRVLPTLKKLVADRLKSKA